MMINPEKIRSGRRASLFTRMSILSIAFFFFPRAETFYFGTYKIKVNFHPVQKEMIRVVIIVPRVENSAPAVSPIPLRISGMSFCKRAVGESPSDWSRMWYALLSLTDCLNACHTNQYTYPIKKLHLLAKDTF